MTENQLLGALIVSIAGAATAIPGVGRRARQDVDASGFYGGLSMRDRGTDSGGPSVRPPFARVEQVHVAVGATTTAHARSPSAAIAGVTTSLSKLPWRPLIASRFDPMAPHSPGMGFALANGTKPAAKTWNVDVYTSWGFAKRFSLYGRLGYIQNESAPSFPANALVGDVRRIRDGVNYGLGLRYDVNTVARPAPGVCALRTSRRRTDHRRAAGVRSGPVRPAVPLLLQRPQRVKSGTPVAVPAVRSDRLSHARFPHASVVTVRLVFWRGCAKHSAARRETLSLPKAHSSVAAVIARCANVAAHLRRNSRRAAPFASPSTMRWPHRTPRSATATRSRCFRRSPAADDRSPLDDRPHPDRRLRRGPRNCRTARGRSARRRGRDLHRHGARCQRCGGTCPRSRSNTIRG